MNLRLSSHIKKNMSALKGLSKYITYAHGVIVGIKTQVLFY